MALDHSCQVQRHPFAERGLDLYETPVLATEMLLRVEKIPPRVWEICAGRGAITRVLQALTPSQRAILAAKVQLGELNISDLSIPQTCQLFTITSANLGKATKHLKAARLLDAAAYLVSVWQGTSPEARIEAIKSIGPDDIFAVLVSAVE